SSADRCNLYGVAQDSYIQFITHALPNQVKVFNTIAIHSNNEWSVDPIEIEETVSYPNGMYSKILSTDFIKEEGVWKVDLNRNMKTRSSSATNYDLVNGSELRGYVMKIKMTNSDTDLTTLFKVDLNSEVSR
ncbi:MAG: hypothetical protein KAS32_18925, partial [Candidatus Peribacteraceae bacterium]|nr:hypothetical protein [Candidatus Peribacteraceae bacterium]